uniref:Uncharacterized protein n=1 Tax=Psilocybe cubensis TaxID=181762 RepID=A0A8H7XX46_PSICU
MLSKDVTACPVLENAKDFQIWQIRIIGKLKREKVYDVITNPRVDSSSITNPSIYPSTTFLATHVDSWEVRDGKAHGIITDHISDRLALATQNERTAAELYAKLYAREKWDGDPETVQDHISSLAAGDSKLVAMKKPIDSEFLGFLLLHSLPDDPVWEMFKTSILNAMPKDSKITFSDIADRLVFNAMRQQGTESAMKAKAMTSKGKVSKHKPNAPKTERFCSFHKSNSHNTEDCNALKKRGKHKTKPKERGKDSANRSSHDSSDSSSSESDSGSDTKSAHFSPTAPPLRKQKLSKQ